MKVPLSDHFDGNRFFNPTLPKGFAPSRLDAIEMAREPHSQWPTWVDNRSSLGVFVSAFASVK
jgi:hypothetical protein